MSDSEGTTPEYNFDDYSDTETCTETHLDWKLNTVDDSEIPIYETITAAEISEKTFAQVQAVKNVLPDDIQITNNALRFLLNKQRWDIEGTSERILLDSEVFLKMNNLTRTEATDSENITIPTTCSVCFEDEIPLTTRWFSKDVLFRVKRTNFTVNKVCFGHFDHCLIKTINYFFQGVVATHF